MTLFCDRPPHFSDQVVSATKESWWECQAWSPHDPFQLSLVTNSDLAQEKPIKNRWHHPLLGGAAPC
jgi:hypothetical protein